MPERFLSRPTNPTSERCQNCNSMKCNEGDPRLQRNSLVTKLMNAPAHNRARRCVVCLAKVATISSMCCASSCARTLTAKERYVCTLQLQRVRRGQIVSPPAKCRSAVSPTSGRAFSVRWAVHQAQPHELCLDAITKRIAPTGLRKMRSMGRPRGAAPRSILG